LLSYVVRACGVRWVPVVARRVYFDLRADAPVQIQPTVCSRIKPPLFDIGPLGASEASVIQAKLNRRLGPEYVSQRPAPDGGPKLTYVEGWKIIGLTNAVFGYNGWCSTVTKIETDFIDMDPESRRYSIGVVRGKFAVQWIRIHRHGIRQ